MKRVVIANPKQVRIIAHAKIKTDTIDAGVLAQLYVSGFLPEVWIAECAPDGPRESEPDIARPRTRLCSIAARIDDGGPLAPEPRSLTLERKGNTYRRMIE